ncbi:MAG: hypothetical protein RR356_04985 [Bacteroidales bacterium]
MIKRFFFIFLFIPFIMVFSQMMNRSDTYGIALSEKIACNDQLEMERSCNILNERNNSQVGF